MAFSVLMSVYARESCEYLGQCLISIREQSLLPDEIIIVEDGPVGDDLKQVIDDFRGCLPIVSLPLSKNVGLGEALNRGLEICSHDLVARMDTDDLCVPDRFQKQIDFFAKDQKSVVLLGGAIEEFDTDPDRPHSLRKLPSGSDKLHRFARKRCPVNHMTVMFRKSAILDAGGYQSFLGMEDYHLWARLLARQYIIDNLPDVLVKARVGNGMIARRRGWHYFRQDVALQREFYSIGFIKFHEAVFNAITRAPFRLLPQGMLDRVYKQLLRKKPATF